MKSLAIKYPTVFANLCWVECDDGWHDIIDRLCALLESRGVVATQIKEKFGGLRFYVEKADDECWAAIDAAEAESLKTCEVCGKPGETRSNNGWLKTTCDTHR